MKARYVAPLTLAILGIVAGPAHAGPKPGNKDFSFVAESPEFRGATDHAYTLALKNLTGTQQLGSSDLAIPSNLTIFPSAGPNPPAGAPNITLDSATVARGGTATLVGSTLQLRNLNAGPGTTVTVSLDVHMPCSGSLTYTVAAKQSNDFSSNAPDGNILTLRNSESVLSTTLNGNCQLRFFDQPKSALAGTQIRADELAPDSTHFVTVEAVDGNGVRMAWFNDPISLTSSPAGLPQTSRTAAGGLATYDDLVIQSSGNYTLVPATAAAGFQSISSDIFDVVGLQAACNPAQCFTDKLNGNKGTSASLLGENVVGTGSALLSLNLGPNPLDSTGCAGYTPPGAGSGNDYYEFRLFRVEADVTYTMEFSKAAMGKRTPMSLEACFATPGPAFIAKDGQTADAFDYDGPGPSAAGFADLLPDCGNNPASPCVSGRGGLPGGGAHIDVFVPRLWSEDPRCT